MKANLPYYLDSLLNFNVIFVDDIRHKKQMFRKTFMLSQKQDFT
jgi:hypothetical protein